MTYIRKDKSCNFSLIKEILQAHSVVHVSGFASKTDDLTSLRLLTLSSIKIDSDKTVVIWKKPSKNKRVDFIVCHSISSERLYKIIDKTMNMKAFL